MYWEFNLMTCCQSPPKDEEDDDDLDLFGEETDEEKKAAAEREASKKASSKKKESEHLFVYLDLVSWTIFINVKIPLAYLTENYVPSGPSIDVVVSIYKVICWRGCIYCLQH